MPDVQLEVAAVVELGPLQFAVVFGEQGAVAVGFGDGDVLPVGTRAGDCGAGKFDANAAFSRGRIVGVLVEPDEVADPVSVGVAGDDDVIVDVVAVEGLERAVSIGLIAIPSI